jgi:hypothetical protein
MLMRIIAKTVIAFGFVGAMALASPSATRAQGFYFEGPGIEFGVGRPYYRDRYYRDYGYYRNYGGPYAYSRPYDDWRWRYRHHRWRDWD